MVDMEVDPAMSDATGRSRSLNETHNATYGLSQFFFFFFNSGSSSITCLNSFASTRLSLLQELIRLVWIVGGYILLRPYLELGFRKLFATTTKEEEDSNNTTTSSAAQALSPVEMGGTAGVVWGAAARKRQEMIRQAWEEEQARLAEERDLDGIDPELLED